MRTTATIIPPIQSDKEFVKLVCNPLDIMEAVETSGKLDLEQLTNKVIELENSRRIYDSLVLMKSLELYKLYKRISASKQLELIKALTEVLINEGSLANVVLAKTEDDYLIVSVSMGEGDFIKVIPVFALKDFALASLLGTQLTQCLNKGSIENKKYSIPHISEIEIITMESYNGLILSSLDSTLTISTSKSRPNHISDLRFHLRGNPINFKDSSANYYLTDVAFLIEYDSQGMVIQIPDYKYVAVSVYGQLFIYNPDDGNCYNLSPVTDMRTMIQKARIANNDIKGARDSFIDAEDFYSSLSKRVLFNNSKKFENEEYKEVGIEFVISKDKVIFKGEEYDYLEAQKVLKDYFDSIKLKEA